MRLKTSCQSGIFKSLEALFFTPETKLSGAKHRKGCILSLYFSFHLQDRTGREAVTESYAAVFPVLFRVACDAFNAAGKGDKAGTLIQSFLFHHVLCLIAQQPCEYSAVFFYDLAFLYSDFPYCVAEHSCMLKLNRSDDFHRAFKRVGRIKPPSESCFDDSPGTLCIPEKNICIRCIKLKGGGFCIDKRLGKGKDDTFS